MSYETPIEIMHLPAALRRDFVGKIPEATSGKPEDRESNFLSRSLAAYAIQKLARCSLDEAAAAVVDGGGDGGIDAIFYSLNAHTLWLVQSKYITNGRGEPDLGGATKFKAGIENLLQGNFAAFDQNEAWKKLIPNLKAIFRDSSLQVRAVVVYSGINLVSEDRRRLFEDLKRRFSPDSDYLQVQLCNLTTVHDWLTGADQGPGVPVLEITLLKPGWVPTPYETVYGLLSLADLAGFYTAHGRRLIAANIRAYKGNTDVNDQILATIRDEPSHFFYLNNGLTAYCERLEVDNLDRANSEQKRVRAFGISIVNGAQTLGSVAEFFSAPPDPAPQGFVFLKIISLERCEDDRSFADRITHSTNFQNQIGARDFVALDEQQERIANQLKLSGIAYHYREDADAPSSGPTNFNLDEATTACACLAQLRDCDFIARVLANRRSLWSLEEVFPPEELNRSIYSRVFRPDRSARTVWRAVQTQRIVIESMQGDARHSTGIRKAFFENCRWLVLNLVFLRLRPEQADELTLTADERSAIARTATEIVEEVWSISEALGFVSRRTDTPTGVETYDQTRHFRSVFSVAADCRRLRDGFLAQLAQARPASVVAPALAPVPTPANLNSPNPQPPATT